MYIHGCAVCFALFVCLILLASFFLPSPCIYLQKRSVEDLKERYYSVCNRLTKALSGEESDLIAYDAPHEVKRKLQVHLLHSEVTATHSCHYMQLYIGCI